MSTSIIIQEGDAATVGISWYTALGEPETPSGVTYQVFDYITREAVSPQRSVGPLSQSMTFTVLSEDLPASTAKFRLLRVKIRGIFNNAEDPHTDYANISVERGYPAS